MTGNEPAHSTESEQVVLGAMMLRPTVIPDVTAILATGDFYSPSHGSIFTAIVTNHGVGEPVDAIAIGATLSRFGDLQRVGGAPYLHTLLSAVPVVDSATWHARRVADLGYARRAEEAGTKLAQISRGGDRDAIARLFALMQEQLLSGDGPVAPSPAAQQGAGATPLVAGYGFARRFPVEHLPPRMREYAIDLAERKQVPVDLPALMMLGILSGVTGPRVLVRRDHDFVQPTNLYVMVGMESSSAKSPPVTELRDGLWLANRTLREQHEKWVEAEQLRLAAEIEEVLAKGKAVTTDLEEKEGLKARARRLSQQAEDLAKSPPPAPVVALDGDTSPEALADRMSTNLGAGAVIDDEGTLLRNLGGQYSGKTANLGIVLKGYDCAPYNPTRITREAGQIGRAALTLAISPQPMLVAEMMQNGTMRETGFINRFIVAMPGDLVGKREGRASVFIDDVQAEPEDRRLKRWWAELLESLVCYETLLDRQAERDAIDSGAAVIDLTREAWKLHYEYQNEFEQRMDPARAGDLCGVRGWAGKHVARVLRLAALLHLASGATPDDRIEEPTMRAAIAIGDWSIEHFASAGRVMGLSDSAGRIKEYIDGTELQCASRTEVNVEVFRKNAPAAQLTAWIDELLATGEYRWGKVQTGGRSRTVIERVRGTPRAA